MSKQDAEEIYNHPGMSYADRADAQLVEIAGTETKLRNGQRSIFRMHSEYCEVTVSTDRS